MKGTKVCECTCEFDIAEGDIIKTPVGLAYFAGEIVGRADGRTVLAQMHDSGAWRVFMEKDCKWVSETDGAYND